MPRAPTPPLPASVLHDALQLGSRDAFTKLYRHYYDRVRYSVMRAALHTGNRADADELVQDVWFRMLSHDRRLLRRYDALRGPFDRFIGFVAYQQALVSAQRRRRHTGHASLDPTDELIEDEHASLFVADLVQSDLFVKLLDMADAELRDDERTLLIDVHLDGRNIRDVAQQLGLTENATYKRNERLKRKLEGMARHLLSAGAPKPRTVSPTTTAVTLLVLMLARQQSAPPHPRGGRGDVQPLRAPSGSATTARNQR